MSPQQEQEYIKDHYQTFDLAKKELRGLTYGKMATLVIVGASCILTGFKFYTNLMNEIQKGNEVNNLQDKDIKNIKETTIPEINKQLNYQLTQIDNLRNNNKH